MVPYQLSEPTTCHPMPEACSETWPARPVMPELLKTTTLTWPRLTAGFSGLGSADGVNEGVALALWVGWSETVVTSRSVGSPPRVATNATAAIATAMMLSITTGDGIAAPRWLRNRMSDLEAETTRGALTLAGGPEATQPADQERVGLEGLGTVDQGVEDLVVARRGHVELLADRGLLGAGVLPPLPLELEDLAVPIAQGRHRLFGSAVECVRGVHGLTIGRCTTRM